MSTVRGRKSEVWNHFYVDPEDEKIAICIHCKGRRMRGTCRRNFSTSSLLKHLNSCRKQLARSSHVPELTYSSSSGIKPLENIASVILNNESKTTSEKSFSHSPKMTSSKASKCDSDSEISRSISAEKLTFARKPHVKSRKKPEGYKVSHKNHLNLVLDSLAKDESFMDVTLTAEGRTMKAHKSILSSVSPYFRSVLRQNPCHHPIIIMPRDICFKELKNIISYIYKGEMTVPADELQSLLRTADVLQVTSLSSPESSNTFSPPLPNMTNDPLYSGSHSKDVDFQPQENSDSEHQSRIDPQDFLSSEMTFVKEEVFSNTDIQEDSQMTPPAPFDEDKPLTISESRFIRESPGQSVSTVVPSSNQYYCPYCQELSDSNKSLQSHLNLKHPNLSWFSCVCGCVFMHRQDYDLHVHSCTT